MRTTCIFFLNCRNTNRSADHVGVAAMTARRSLSQASWPSNARWGLRRSGRSRAPASQRVRDLSGFDFAAQPSLDPKQVRELAGARWIANGESVLLLGATRVGTTHLAVALGREAILVRHSVQFVAAPRSWRSSPRATAKAGSRSGSHTMPSQTSSVICPLRPMLRTSSSSWSVAAGDSNAAFRNPSLLQQLRRRYPDPNPHSSAKSGQVRCAWVV
jgi:IstB-like ATP binding protein